MYLIPKEKDPPKKSRLISSYSAHPLRTVYKRTSAILTWCFSEISDYKHFTLYKLSDIKKRTKAACRWFRRLGPSTDLLTIQTDVKQMYTNLKHNEILTAINWLLDKVLSNLNKRKRNLKFLLIDKTNKKIIRPSTGTDNENWISFTKQDIINVVTLDLSTAYQTANSSIFRQTTGCPMGGYLSAIYANVKCAYDESLFIHNLGPTHNRIYGIRQMDDLLLWIAYNRTSYRSRIEAEKLKQTILTNNKLYKGGLELEEQERLEGRDGRPYNKFAGTQIRTATQPGITIVVAPHNRNSDTLKTSGLQQYPRFPHFNSFTPLHYKTGTLRSTFIRLESQSSDTQPY